MTRIGQQEIRNLIELVPAPVVAFRLSDGLKFENANWRNWLQETQHTLVADSEAEQFDPRLSTAAREFLAESCNERSSMFVGHRCFHFARIKATDTEFAMISPDFSSPTDAHPADETMADNGGNHSRGDGNTQDYVDDDVKASLKGMCASPLSTASALDTQIIELSAQYFGLGLWELDPIAESCWYSSRLSRMRGMPARDWNGPFEVGIEAVHQNDRSLIRERLRSLAEDDEPFDIQVRIKTIEHTYRWIRACAIAIRDERGKAVRIVGAAQDIDASLRRDDQIRISEDRLHSVADHAPVLIGIGTASAGLQYVNLAWQQVTGASSDELAGDGWKEFVFDEDREAFNRMFGTQNAEVSVLSHRCQMKGADGSIHQMLWRASNLPRKDKSDCDVILVATDVTAHYMTAERLTLALDVAGAGMWDWRVDKETFTATKRLFTIVGEQHETGHLPFRWFVERLHPDDVEHVFQYIQRGHEDDAFDYDMQFRMKHSAGGYRWIRSKGRVVERDTTGSPIRMIGLHVDITEQKEVENALRSALHEASDARNRLSEILRHAPAAIAIFDRNMRFLAVSERWRQDYELGTVALIGTCVYDVMDIPRRWRDVHMRCLAGATETCEEDFWIKPNGQKKWERWEVCPWFDASRHEIGGISIFTNDITSRKLAEAELAAHSDRLAHISRMNVVDQIGIQIAHDLKHPIATLLNQAHVVRESIENEVGAEHPMVGELDEIRSSALRISELVDNLRSYAARTPVSRTRINFGDVIKSTLRVIRTKAGAAGIEILCIDDSDGATILGDVTQIQQVLINLILNGIDSIVLSGADFGTIKICAAREQSTHVSVVISDSGPGFGPEGADNAFQRFHTTKRDGLGAGLLICKRIVEAHEGSIFFTSFNPAIVCVKFPLKAGACMNE